MRSQLVRPILLAVSAAGGDVEALIRAHALPPDAAQAPEVSLPLDGLEDVARDAARATGDPWIGLSLAAADTRGTYDLVEFICERAPDLESALQRLSRYVCLLNELVEFRVELDPDAGEACLHHAIPGWPGAAGRHANEFVMASLVGQCRRLLPGRFAPTRAWLAHAAPSLPLEPLQRALGTTDLTFGQASNGVAFPARWLHEPLETSDPPLLAVLERQAERLLAERGGKSRFVGEIRRRVLEVLHEAPPTLDELASQLAMSPRTLQRRLSAQGTSLSAIVDEIRAALARQLVHAGDQPLGEVAWRLGYSEMSAFLRAFKRWTGTTPTRFRAGVC